MAKTATKRKEFSVSSIRRRLSAALIMLLVSSIMLVATTYAWFTLSTAPEVKNIDTTVAGNGSLEIALLPTDGDITAIKSGRGTSGDYAGGNALATAANVSWGNLLDLSDASYGLGKLQLTPAHAEVATSGETTTFTFGTTEFGYDGRVKSTNTSEADPYSFNTDRFNGTNKGVRALLSSAASARDVSAEDATVDAFGYVLDLVFRANTADGKLVLQQEGIQRVYNSATDTERQSTAAPTQGGGSKVTAKSGLKIAFVKNYATDEADEFLGYAVADTDGNLKLVDASGADKEALITLEDGVATQISAIVFREGANLTNADLAPEDVPSEATVNLQFALGGVTLVPSIDADLRDNPPAPANNTPEPDEP